LKMSDEAKEYFNDAERQTNDDDLNK
jgi:hypothetical protein